MLHSITQAALAAWVLVNCATAAGDERDATANAADRATITPFPSRDESGRFERRQASSDLRTCGYVGGVSSLSLTCAIGQCDFSPLAQNPRTLIAGCKTGSQEIYPTRCFDYTSTSVVVETVGVLSCVSTAPYCQFYTWPEVSAAAFACGPTSARVTVFLTPRPSTATSTEATTPPGSIGTTKPTDGSTSLPTKGRGPLGLTKAQKIGIAVGSVAGGCIFAGVLFFCCRGRLHERARVQAAAQAAANALPKRPSQEKPPSTNASIPTSSPSAASPPVVSSVSNTPTGNHLSRAQTS